MPEMPEVETVRRTLSDKVLGRIVRHMDILLPRLIKWPSVHEFQENVTGKSICQLRRRGKYLLFDLSDGMVMVVHLRMTGRLHYNPVGAVRHPHTRIVFKLDTGDELLYIDTRTLGTLHVMPESELNRIHGLTTMGPEPLSADFTLDYLRGILDGRQGNIKALLLNQQYVGGLGNIYVDECLALAGIHPERRAGAITMDEIEKLHTAINQVIDEGIRHGGTTLRDYRDGEGASGNHQHHLAVYGRASKPCRNCGTAIVKSIVAGRGTHFCPRCQT